LSRARAARALIAAGLVGLVLTLLLPTPARADNRVAVVMANGSMAEILSLDDLAAIYRRRKLFVAGVRLQPVNLDSSHPLRRFFSRSVLRSTPEELENYWRNLYFNGVLPPFVLGSEEAVLRFVASTPGAIGYVSYCDVDRRVAVLLLLEGGPPCPR
jgi:hypothetical protein